jgi:hypothetical protein
MPANRMNRDGFYAAMAPHDDASLRKILWTVYWRGNAQLRERIEDELRPQDQRKVKPKNELPDPIDVLAEVTTFVELAKDGAYMAGGIQAPPAVAVACFGPLGPHAICQPCLNEYLPGRGDGTAPSKGLGSRAPWERAHPTISMPRSRPGARLPAASTTRRTRPR